MKKEELLKELENKCLDSFGCSINEASKLQVYKTLCTTVRDMLAHERKDFTDKVTAKEEKQVYYMSMEFLVGTSLHNNLFNMGIEDTVRSVLKDKGFDLTELYEMEPDAGLGNGGLGRLASCYMDSMTTLGYPGTGFSIRYEFGIFRQKIVDGAVGMVEMALERITENKVCELDDERKAQMVSNLLVVLCGNKDAQPIVNSGSIY